MDVMYVYQNNVSMDIGFMLTLFFGLLISSSIGSFISVLTYRIPRNLGFIKGRSFCDNCGETLKWYDNIPLFSYLIYKGKSRCCKQKISIRYPLIEILSVVGSLLIFFATNNVLINLLLFYITLTILIIDFENQIIPDEFNWLILILLVILNFEKLPTVLILGLIPALFLLLINLITKGKGMGLGDVKLALVLGGWLSFLGVVEWLFISFLTGGLVASILLLLGNAKLKSKIAFGPFLIIGFWIVKYLGISFLKF